MTDPISSAVTAASLGGGVGIAYLLIRLIQWAFEYWGARMDKKADRIDEGNDKLIKLLQGQVRELLEREKDREAASLTRRELLEAKIEKVQAEVVTLRAELAECKARHSESEAEVKHLKAEIEELRADR